LLNSGRVNANGGEEIALNPSLASPLGFRSAFDVAEVAPVLTWSDL